MLEVDDAKLQRLMTLTGLSSRDEAVDFALTEAERAARLKQLLSRSLYVWDGTDPIDPNYDLMKLREMEKPDYGTAD